MAVSCLAISKNRSFLAVGESAEQPRISVFDPVSRERLKTIKFPASHLKLRSIHQLFFYAGGSETLIAHCSNLKESFLVTFDLESMAIKEQIPIGETEELAQISH